MKFIKYSFRFSRKFKSYTLLNITGITIAIILLISGSLFFATQLTYDNFHSDYVYRVQLGKEPGAAVVFPALAEGLKSNFSAITETTRLKKTSLTIQYGNSRIADIGSYYVDGSFFDVLTYKHLYGKTADLKKPHTAFISEALAERLAKDPASLVGETLLFPKKHGYDTYTIAGILENVPRNSHLQFDMLESYSSLDEGKPTFPYGWAFKGVYTYIKASTPLQITSEQSKQLLSQQKTSEQNNSIKSEETLDLVPIT